MNTTGAMTAMNTTIANSARIAATAAGTTSTRTRRQRLFSLAILSVPIFMVGLIAVVMAAATVLFAPIAWPASVITGILAALFGYVTHLLIGEARADYRR